MTTYYDAEASSSFLQISLPRNYLKLYAECYEHHSHVGKDISPFSGCKHSQETIDWMNSPEYVKENSERTKLLWKDAAYRESNTKPRPKTSKRQKELWQDPAYVENMSVHAKARWADPEFRKRVTKKITETMRAKADKKRMLNDLVANDVSPT